MLLQPQDKQGPGKSFSQGHQPHWSQNTTAPPKGPGVCPTRTHYPQEMNSQQQSLSTTWETAAICRGGGAAAGPHSQSWGEHRAQAAPQSLSGSTRAPPAARGAGGITAGMRCAAEPDFPTDPQDSSSCQGSRAEDEPGRTGLTMSLLLCSTACPRAAITRAGVIAVTPQCTRVHRGGHPAPLGPLALPNLFPHLPFPTSHRSTLFNLESFNPTQPSTFLPVQEIPQKEGENSSPVRGEQLSSTGMGRRASPG